MVTPLPVLLDTLLPESELLAVLSEIPTTELPVIVLLSRLAVELVREIPPCVSG